ncbi:hypothetical protein SETIT_2G159800v2 [Setaria italica]|uniref:Dirigent protein n=2 Tax=Setaria TaxID=4554 RepID=K4A2S8_SETIT|nr:hypothetical protein SETIT_2G159800v2 [Setaria italica]TKW32362.1 hypothetical protein SEVIR_2G164600v2 [Setaria viridis]
MAQPYFEIASAPCPLQRNEFYMHLYLRQTGSGSDRTQAEIVPPKEPNSFGVTHVIDWPIAVVPEPAATIVARAQGLLMQAGLINPRTYTSFNIVFEDDRRKSNNQWAISSGTGGFALAHGIIRQKVMPLDGRRDTNIKELHIHAFYTPMNNSVVPGATDGKS